MDNWSLVAEIISNNDVNLLGCEGTGLTPCKSPSNSRPAPETIVAFY